MNGASRGVARNASSSASRTPASSLVEDGRAVDPVGTQRERHQRRADRARHREALPERGAGPSARGSAGSVAGGP